MTTLHGKGGMVYLQGSGTVALKIGECKTWSLKIDSDQQEDNVMGDLWATSLKGLLKWSGKVDGNFDTAQVTPFEAATAQTAKALYLYPAAATVTNYYYGTVWPKLSVDFDMASIGKFSLDFEGDGQLAAN